MKETTSEKLSLSASADNKIASILPFSTSMLACNVLSADCLAAASAVSAASNLVTSELVAAISAAKSPSILVTSELVAAISAAKPFSTLEILVSIESPASVI